MELLTKSSSYSESLSYTDIPTKFLLRHKNLYNMIGTFTTDY